MYGVCPGLAVPGSDRPGVTDWLHEKIQACAGRCAGDPDAVLTIQDLADQGIRLVMMTTDLSCARPQRLPFRDGGSGPGPAWAFKIEEFRRLFPAAVVDRMAATPPPPSGVGGAGGTGGTGGTSGTGGTGGAGRLTPLPDGHAWLPSGADLPVIVATRLSLSFPVLLSAVPLYDMTAGNRRHLFSDGGIGSNFPIQFFDAWLPSCPTFGLSLGTCPTAGSEHAGDAAAGVDAHVSLLSAGGGAVSPRFVDVATLPSFLHQVLDTMQNWRDTLQSELPGFRDRVCEIRLHKDEGGMNLAMDEATIQRLLDKGAAAGRRLAGAFPTGDAHDVRWQQHRRDRFVVLMQQLQRGLRGGMGNAGGLAAAWEGTAGARRDLLPPVTPPGALQPAVYAGAYVAPRDDQWRARALAATDALVAAANAWQVEFDTDDVPTPTPALRLSPDV
jgi:hypothetical protein